MPFMLFGVIHATFLPVGFTMLPKYSRKPELSILKEIQLLEKTEKIEEMENKKVLKPWNLLKIPRTMLMTLVILVTGVYWSFLGANLEEHLFPVGSSKKYEHVPVIYRVNRNSCYTCLGPYRNQTPNCTLLKFFVLYA